MTNSPRYDEARRLRHYVVEYYRHLLTEEELQICRAWRVRKKADAAGKSVEDYFPSADALPQMELLGDDPDTALEQVAQRVLRDHEAQVFINRCPECDRLVATPRAQQCLWCGHDWH